MRNIVATLVLYCLASCGFLPTIPDFTTRQGVRVFMGDCSYPQEDIERLLDVFAEQMPRLVEGVTSKQIYDMYAWTSIFWQDSVIHLAAGDAYGTYGARTIFLWCNDRNLCKTALLHEYTHMVQDIKYSLTIANTNATLHTYPEFEALNKLNVMLWGSELCQ